MFVFKHLFITLILSINFSFFFQIIVAIRSVWASKKKWVKRSIIHYEYDTLLLAFCVLYPLTIQLKTSSIYNILTVITAMPLSVLQYCYSKFKYNAFWTRLWLSNRFHKIASNYFAISRNCFRLLFLLKFRRNISCRNLEIISSYLSFM